MPAGFHLFIDEAGNEGLERVRPIDPDGSPEYFVICGVLISQTRYQEALNFLRKLRHELGVQEGDYIHFRDLDKDRKNIVIRRISESKLRIFVIVSNKRNMRGYRNRRCESRYFEVVNGRIRPKRNNWFYNHTFRYLLERVSRECKKYSNLQNGYDHIIRIIFSFRKSHSYSQTKAYLHKLKAERRPSYYPNNKGQVEWSMVDPSMIDGKRVREEPLLQFADCVASAIYAAIDEDWLKAIEPNYVEVLANRFARMGASPRDYGFTLLPKPFSAPLSLQQRRTLRAVGYSL